MLSFTAPVLVGYTLKPLPFRHELNTRALIRPRSGRISHERERTHVAVCELPRSLTNVARLFAAAAILLSAQPFSTSLALAAKDCNVDKIYNLGLANAEGNKVIDYSSCDLSNKDLSGITFSGALLEKTNFSGSNLTNVTLTKANAKGAIFDRAVLKNAVLDRVNFNGASFKEASFENAVIAGATFDDADVSNADFTDASIDTQNFRKLCSNASGKNSKSGADTRESLGCY